MQRLKEFLFRNTTNRQTIMKNTFWLFASEGVSRLLKMVLVIYAARVLGAEGWGVFSYALSLGSLLMIFGDIGLSGLITREIVQKKEGYVSFISTALLVKGIVLTLSTLVVIFVGPVVSHVDAAKSLLPLIALVLLFDGIRDFLLVLNTAFEKMERDMIAKIILSTVTVGVGIGLLQIGQLPEFVAVAYLIGSAAGCIAAYLTLRNDIKGLFSKFDTRIILFVLRTTWPFAIITLINTVMANTDIYLLGIWRSTTEIGLYASAQRIQQFIFMIPVIIATAVFPLLSRLATKDDSRFATILGKTTALILAIGVPITVGGILLSDQLVALVFGVGYAGAAPVLQILLLMLLASFPLILFSNSIVAYNGQKNLPTIYGCGVIANILLNIMLIPPFGAVGSAIATLISTTIITVLMWRKLQKKTSFTVLAHLKRTMVAVVGMVLGIIALKRLSLHIGITVILSSLIYIGLLLLLKEPLITEARAVIKSKSIV